MTKIATWGDLNTLTSTTLNSNTTKCPTYIEINNTGSVTISGSYTSNQLVKLSDCSMAEWKLYGPKVHILIESESGSQGEFGANPNGFINIDMSITLATSQETEGMYSHTWYRTGTISGPGEYSDLVSDCGYFIDMTGEYSLMKKCCSCQSQECYIRIEISDYDGIWQNYAKSNEVTTYITTGAATWTSSILETGSTTVGPSVVYEYWVAAGMGSDMFDADCDDGVPSMFTHTTCNCNDANGTTNLIIYMKIP